MAIQENENVVRRPALPIAMFRALRAYQWTKNLLVLAALVFAQELGDPVKVALALEAFVAFCMASSATYILNDLMDVEKDRAHPKKRHRPIASGALPLPAAYAMAGGLLVGALLLGYTLGWAFLGALVFYLVLTSSYTLVLKNVIIIDVMAIAFGFVVRAVAGAFAVDVTFSNWLVVCTLFLALFLALNKRRSELVLLEDGATEHRAVLVHYSTQYLDALIYMMAAGAMLTYTIYTCDAAVVERFGTDKLYLTLPFVVYGLFRYLFLVHQQTGGGDPGRALLRDWPTGLTVLLWGLSCIAIIYLA